MKTVFIDVPHTLNAGQIVRISGLKSEYVILSVKLLLSPLGDVVPFYGIAHKEEYEKYGIGANVRTFTGGYLEAVTK